MAELQRHRKEQGIETCSGHQVCTAGLPDRGGLTETILQATDIPLVL